MWEKKKCYVVTAFYKYELYDSGEAPMSEEFVFLSMEKALKQKEECEYDEDFEEVCFDEDEREFWV